MLILFVFFGVFLVTLFFYWKIPFYFYLMDDWSSIDQYQKFGMKSISLSVNEHFVPIDRILYYIETKIYGLNSIYLHYETIFIHFLVTISLIYFIYLLFKKKSLSFLAGFIFAFNPLLWESFFLQGGRYTMLNVLLFFTSLIYLLLFLQKRKSVFFTLSIFFLVFQTFTFGFGIFLNFIYFLFFILFSNRKKDKQKIILVFIVIISLTLLFIFFGSLKALDLGIDKFPLTEKAKMISNYFYFAVISNFVRPFIFFILPSNFNVVSKKIYLSFFFFFLLIFYAFINDKKNKKILIWTLFYYLSFIISISLSRYDWGPAQSLSSRYIYNFLPALIILVCWLIDTFENKIKRFANVLALSTVVFYSTVFIYNYKIVSFYKNLYSRLHYYNYSQLKKKEIDIDYFATTSQITPVYNQKQLLYMFKILRSSAIFKNYPNIPDEYPPVKKSQSYNLYPDNNNHIPGGITNNTNVYQTFISGYGKLTGINIFISTFGKKIITPYELIVFDSKCENQIRKTLLDYKKIIDNEYFQIFFKEIYNSKNIKYCFTIKPLENKVVTPITIQLSKPDKYLDGELRFNNIIKEEDLVFEPLFN